jgi:hypothetical protein
MRLMSFTVSRVIMIDALDVTENVTQAPRLAMLILRAPNLTYPGGRPFDALSVIDHEQMNSAER